MFFSVVFVIILLSPSPTVWCISHYYHFVPISCNEIAHKLMSEDSKFFQFDFDKSLTEEIDIKIYDTFWRVDTVTEVNIHEGDLKIEFLHLHGSRKTFSWPFVADKYFFPASNIYLLSQLQQQPLDKCMGSQTLTLNKL